MECASTKLVRTCAQSQETKINVTSPLSLNVPREKVNLISFRFRWALFPQHSLTSETMVSSIECEAELKCSATGSPGDLLHANTAQMFTDVSVSSSLTDVHSGTTAACDAVHNILRLVATL